MTDIILPATRTRGTTGCIHHYGNGIGLHLFAIHRGRGAFKDVFASLFRLQHKRDGFVLGRIAIDDTHTAGLNRALHDMESRKLRGSKTIDLPGVLYDKLYLEIISAADLLTTGYSSKFH